VPCLSIFPDLATVKKGAGGVGWGRVVSFSLQNRTATVAAHIQISATRELEWSMVMSNLHYIDQAKKRSAPTACTYCEGTQEHQPWCATRAPKVFYAYAVVTDPSKLMLGDRLALHSLGVAWDETPV